MTRRPTASGGKWLARALVTALVVGHAVAAAVWLPDDHIYADAAQVTDLATYPVMLAAAGLLYLYFRLTDGEDTAWLATAAVFGTAQGAGYAALRVVMEEEFRARPGWLMLSHVGVAALVALLLAMSGRARVPVDPVVLGLALALAVTGVRLVLLERVEPMHALQELEPPMGAALLLLYVVAAAILVGRVRLPGRTAHRLAAVLVALGVAQLLVYPVPVDDWRSLLVVALDVGGVTLLVVTSLELVQSALSRTHQAEQRVRLLEQDVRHDRTLLHEVAGTVAGISAASRLLTVPVGIAPGQRRHLEELVAAETARVDRMLTATRSSAEGQDDLVDVDLDALIDPLLFNHGIRGRVVAWHPTGDHVLALPDQLREVLDLLLDNASRHARTPILAVTVTRIGDRVEVAVVDQGPGIPPEIAATVWEWGTHGDTSAGQGIGLHVARRLVTSMGGGLRIDSDGHTGTRAVVTLALAPRGDSPRSPMRSLT